MPIKSSNDSFLLAICNYIGRALANFLNKPRLSYDAFSLLSQAQLKATLTPGDLILVEGNSRISSAIKYLTQSTWSHVCVYIGEHKGLQPLLEADLVKGVITVPLDKYDGFNLRICRAQNLTPKDTKALIAFLVERIGMQYDTKNIIDLMRYLLPTPPVPARFRRSMLSFGSGDPTKAICSTLVAQAFQSINYPILPVLMNVEKLEQGNQLSQPVHPTTSLKNRIFNLKRDRLSRKHHTHFTPRDFDLSPYFNVVKPTLHAGFDYKKIQWHVDS